MEHYCNLIVTFYSIQIFLCYIFNFLSAKELNFFLLKTIGNWVKPGECGLFDLVSATDSLWLLASYLNILGLSFLIIWRCLTSFQGPSSSSFLKSEMERKRDERKRTFSLVKDFFLEDTKKYVEELRLTKIIFLISDYS